MRERVDLMSRLFLTEFEHSFRGMGADTLTFCESTSTVSRAFPISLVRIPTTHMKSLYSKQRNAGKSRLFLTKFMNTTFRGMGADTLTFYESTPIVFRALPISLVRIPTTDMENLYSKQRNAGIHKHSFKGMGADTLTFYESTPFVSRALLISLIRISTTDMENRSASW